MQLLSLKNVCLKYSEKPLLKNINFTICEKERICLVGRNGAGKSSLLKIIQRNIEPDSGVVIYKDDLRISYLEQELPREMVLTSREIISHGLGEIGELIVNYEKLLALLNQGIAIDEKKLSNIQKEIDNNDGWSKNQKIEKLITQMSIDPTNSFNSLSGGQKKRVMLAKAIISEPDFLILDEPTNHLDIPSIIWLENFLQSTDIALIFVTHDRFLLDSVATKITELDRGELFVYPSGYDAFLKLRAKRWHEEEIKSREFNKKLAKEEIWIREGIKARRKRNEGRVRALKQLRIAKKEQLPVQSKPAMTINEAKMSGKIVIKAENLTLAFPNSKPLISNFSVTIQRGDKVGIVGKNGVGKTTLVEGLLGNLKPVSGKTVIGSKVSAAYFDQMRGMLKEDQSIMSAVSAGRDFININGTDKHVVSYLQDFLFTPDKFRTPVSSLSGGEKNRLLLALLFSRTANLLILDEPTNDLDIETLELLEDKLQSFNGTILAVSHDRYFLDNIATHTIVITKNKADFYVGGYSESTAKKEEGCDENNTKTVKQKSNSVKGKTKQRKLSYNEENRLRIIPDEVTSIEKQINLIQEMLSDEKIYKENHQQALQAEKELRVMENNLQTLFDEWESLERKKAMFQNKM